MELKESKKLKTFIREMKRKNHSVTYNYNNDLLKDLEIVLQTLENSIPKEKIEQYLTEEQERFNVYKKESKTNENLRLGMWKHLGAKNMCEKILGIEKSIATLD